jgi:hypothetical protein
MIVNGAAMSKPIVNGSRQGLGCSSPAIAWVVWLVPSAGCAELRALGRTEGLPSKGSSIRCVLGRNHRGIFRLAAPSTMLGQPRMRGSRAGTTSLIVYIAHAEYQLSYNASHNNAASRRHGT